MNRPEYNWFEMCPVDAWFFRDGRPSNRDEDQSDLQSQFPPPHQTVVGAIRAAIAREHGWSGKGDWPAEIKSVLGDGFEDLGALSFDGPFVAIDGNPLFPAPGHLLGRFIENRNGPGDDKQFEPLTWRQPSSEKIICDWGEVRLPESVRIPSSTFDTEPQLIAPDQFFITTSGMELVLQGRLPKSEHFIHQDQLFAFEPRVGIERDHSTRTTGENAMYHPIYVRLKNRVSILIGIAGLGSDWMPPGLFPLGGESRMATLEKITAPKMPQSPDDGDLVVLVAPARFSGECWFGAGPDDPAGALSKNFSGDVQTASVDRPRYIGGFDSRIQSKGPLPLSPFVAPGAIWWLEEKTRTNAEDEPLQLGVRTQYGYGRAFLGRRMLKQ